MTTDTSHLPRVAATDAAHAAGRTLADQHLSHAELVRVSGFAPSIIDQLSTQEALAAGYGIELLGLQDHAEHLHAALGDAPFTGPYGVAEAAAFLAGVRAVKQSTDNGYREVRAA